LRETTLRSAVAVAFTAQVWPVSEPITMPEASRLPDSVLSKIAFCEPERTSIAAWWPTVVMLLLCTTALLAPS
jgi:hypothetical protein